VRAVDLTTERLFGLRLARETCEEIDRRCRELRRPGYYRDVLVGVANVERCQVNSLDTDPFCETEMPELFDQDISIAGLVRGAHPRAEELSGIEVGSLDDYLRVIEWTFERYAALAVATKCFWAYFRSLAVGPVAEPPRRAFERLRAGTADAHDRRLVEDFLFRRCVELSTAAGLPVKVHLGSLARNNDPHLEWVYACVSDMTRLVQEYPRTTFVLMHMAWPQQEQLLALAKHQPNVVVEMSWAWTAAPRSAADFLERFLTTVPANKLLGFGADYQTVENVVGHAELARRGLERALQSLVDSGWLSIDDALRVVPLVMRENAARILPSPAGRPLPSVTPS
jgi:predicted TIM-barrel fold metal-dependent hydrolase